MASQQENGFVGPDCLPPVKEPRKPKDKIGVYPEPVIVPPQLEHRQTFIMLHGRGSTAASAFPYAKLIFLTASREKATIYKKPTHQWFDGCKMEDFTERQDLSSPGLNKSCKYVHGILQKEIDSVGGANVVLWGLSQGCATSLISLLTWGGEPFGATVGMCGYLPFSNHIIDIAEGNMQMDDLNDDDQVVFSDEDSDGESVLGEEVLIKDDLSTRALTFLREEIDLGRKSGVVVQNVPVFLGHGTEDDVVPFERALEAKRCLELFDADVKWVEYDGLGHWYSADMLGDILDCLREQLHVQH